MLLRKIGNPDCPGAPHGEGLLEHLPALLPALPANCLISGVELTRPVHEQQVHVPHTQFIQTPLNITLDFGPDVSVSLEIDGFPLGIQAERGRRVEDLRGDKNILPFQGPVGKLHPQSHAQMPVCAVNKCSIKMLPARLQGQLQGTPGLIRSEHLDLLVVLRFSPVGPVPESTTKPEAGHLHSVGQLDCLQIGHDRSKTVVADLG
mmetsp:Transcript_34564/g.75690  ORF Transcript_34564/g.75690 Transcript_34564/m.75690 type:complete len:205 (+) Transcript_34564:632-1246(+)